AVTRATTLTRLTASIRPRNSLVSVIGRLTASTTPTAGGPLGAGCAQIEAVVPIARTPAIARPIGNLARFIPRLTIHCGGHASTVRLTGLRHRSIPGERNKSGVA